MAIEHVLRLAYVWPAKRRGPVECGPVLVAAVAVVVTVAAAVSGSAGFAIDREVV